MMRCPNCETLNPLAEPYECSECGLGVEPEMPFDAKPEMPFDAKPLSGNQLLKDYIEARDLRFLKRSLTLKTRPYRGEPETIRCFDEDADTIWLPRHFDDDDMVDVPPAPLGSWPTMPPLDFKWTLDPERGQPEGKEAMVRHLAHHAGGVLVAFTGCGKTVLSYAIAAEFGTPIAVLVYAEHMIKTWVDHAKDCLGLTDDDIGFVQEERCDLGKPVTILMVQSLYSGRRYPDALYKQFGFIVADECIAGESRIVTDVGVTMISEIPLCGASYVLSFNEARSTWEWKRILRWMPKGWRRTIVVRVGNQTLRCTSDHLLLTRKRGWIEAQYLRATDEVLFPASAGAVNFSSRLTSVADLAGSFTVIHSTSDGGARTGVAFERSFSGMRRCAPAVAEIRSRCGLTSDGRASALTSIQDGSSVITRAGRSASRSQKEQSGWSTGLYSETLPSRETKEKGLTRASSSHTVRRKAGGRDIRPSSFPDSVLLSTSGQTEATASSPIVVTVFVTLLYRTLRTLLANLRRCLLTGSNWFRTRGGLGGTRTTETVNEGAYGFIPKGSPSRRSDSSRISSLTDSSCPPSYLRRRDVTGSSGSESETRSTGCRGSGSSRSPGWTTSFLKVTSVEEDPRRGCEVFDLEVEDNHNFVAEGMLVHNCHRYGAPVWQSVLQQFPARYRLGVSADPRRTDGLGEIVTWSFGRVGHTIEKADSLARPLVVQLEYDTTYKRGAYCRWEGGRPGDPDPGKYRKCLAKDEGRNIMFMREAVEARKKGRRCIVFAHERKHLLNLLEKFTAMIVKEGIKTTSALFISKSKQKGEPDDMKSRIADVEGALAADMVFTTYSMSRASFNKPDLDTAIAVTPVSSLRQPLGRLRDKGPEDRQPLLWLEAVEANDYAEEQSMKRVNFFDDLGCEVKVIKRAKIDVPKPKKALRKKGSAGTRG